MHLHRDSHRRLVAYKDGVGGSEALLTSTRLKSFRLLNGRVLLSLKAIDRD